MEIRNCFDGHILSLSISENYDKLITWPCEVTWQI